MSKDMSQREHAHNKYQSFNKKLNESVLYRQKNQNTKLNQERDTSKNMDLSRFNEDRTQNMSTNAQKFMQFFDITKSMNFDEFYQHAHRQHNDSDGDNRSRKSFTQDDLFQHNIQKIRFDLHKFRQDYLAKTLASQVKPENYIKKQEIIKKLKEQIPKNNHQDWNTWGSFLSSFTQSLSEIGGWTWSDVFALFKLAQKHGESENPEQFIQGEEITSSKTALKLLEQVNLSYAVYAGKDYQQIANGTHLKYHEVLHAEDISVYNCPAYYIAGDCLNKEIVWVLRGTKQMSDVCTDLTTHCDDSYGVVSHQGLKRSAFVLIERVSPIINHLLDYKEYEGFGVKVIGHSLGAGVAALVTYILNSVDGYKDKCKAQSIKGIVFGCPPCLPYDSCVDARDYLVTVLCQYDIVSRMSLTNLQRLLVEVREFTLEEERKAIEQKYKGKGDKKSVKVNFYIKEAKSANSQTQPGCTPPAFMRFIPRGSRQSDATSHDMYEFDEYEMRSTDQGLSQDISNPNSSKLLQHRHENIHHDNTYGPFQTSQVHYNGAYSPLNGDRSKKGDNKQNQDLNRRNSNNGSTPNSLHQRNSDINRRNTNNNDGGVYSKPPISARKFEQQQRQQGDTGAYIKIEIKPRSNAGSLLKKFRHQNKKQLFPKEYLKRVQENEASKKRLDKIKQSTIDFYTKRFAKQQDPTQQYKSRIEDEVIKEDEPQKFENVAQQYDKDYEKNKLNADVELFLPGTIYHLQRFKDDSGFEVEKLIRAIDNSQTPLKISLQATAIDDHYLGPYIRGFKNIIKYKTPQDQNPDLHLLSYIQNQLQLNY